MTIFCDLLLWMREACCWVEIFCRVQRLVQARAAEGSVPAFRLARPHEGPPLAWICQVGEVVQVGQVDPVDPLGDIALGWPGRPGNSVQGV